MDNAIKTSIWKQFGASIDMLENAVLHCPAHHWDTDRQIWYNAYHCLFFLDYYLTLEPRHFLPPPPFDCSEFEDRMPARVYTQAELLAYLDFCRKKCHALVASLTDETAQYPWVNESQTMRYSLFEILLYNMRHVQHHAAQINLLLRQAIDDAPEWVFQAKD